MSTVYGDGLHMTDRGSYGEGRVIYSLGISDRGKNFTFPGRRQMKRLSRTFLGGELQEHKEFPRTTRGFRFSIPIGTSAEKRAAFLGAVRHYCKKL